MCIIIIIIIIIIPKSAANRRGYIFVITDFVKQVFLIFENMKIYKNDVNEITYEVIYCK